MISKNMESRAKNPGGSRTAPADGAAEAAVVAADEEAAVADAATGPPRQIVVRVNCL